MQKAVGGSWGRACWTMRFSASSGRLRVVARLKSSQIQLKIKNTSNLNGVFLPFCGVSLATKSKRCVFAVLWVGFLRVETYQPNLNNIFCRLGGQPNLNDAFLLFCCGVSLGVSLGVLWGP